MKFYVAFTVENGMVVEADSKEAARAEFEKSRADALEVLSETIKEDDLKVTRVTHIPGKGHGITLGMVLWGLQNGVVSIVDHPDGDGAVCQIGEHWFYFGGLEAEEQTAKEYTSNVPEKDIAEEILGTLEEFCKNPDTFGDEYGYYEAILLEKMSE